MVGISLCGSLRGVARFLVNYVTANKHRLLNFFRADRLVHFYHVPLRSFFVVLSRDFSIVYSA